MAKERQFVTGENIDAKFTKINKVLNRLSKRAMTVTGTIVMPQIPILCNLLVPGEDGVLLRTLLPLSGTVRKALLHAERVAAKTKPKLSITVTCGDETKTTTVAYKQGRNVIEPATYVEAGTVLTLSTSDPTNVSGLSLGLIFEPDVSSATKEQVALSAHLESVEADDAGETTEGETT